MKNPPLTLKTKYGTAYLNRRGYYILPHCYGANKPGPLHRKIYANHIGRRIPLNYEIHHINGIKTDNRIENLVALHRDDHRLLHEH